MLGILNHRKVRTSYVERQNLTLRMNLTRIGLLTLAFSKKLVDLKAAVARHFLTYDFCLIHRSLRITPAIAASFTDRIWEIWELLYFIHPPSK